ncbi:MAG TPA: metallophosphoesterase [Myxococcales bacterium]|nr:metallophosphoesterase [Myxococcales bacterium]
MPLYVVSDLHLGDNTLASMFRDADQGFRFADLCSAIARNAGSELILLGDIFDLTAATPPPKGLSDFGRLLEVPIEDKEPRGLAQIMKQIREANPVALDALEALSNDVQVTLVPGNHDRHLGEEGGRDALDAAGLSRVNIESMAVRRVMDKVVVLQHGHAWDPSNSTATGGGETMTSVIHHAIVPFLRHLAPRSNIRIEPDRIVALRPEERVVPVLQRWLKPGTFETFIDAFLELLVANGYLSRAVAWLATPGIIRSRLKDDDDLWEHAGLSALAALEGGKPLPGKPPPPDVLVLGHTHVVDWAVAEGARAGIERLYVNLGTWSARASDAAGPMDATMPLLRIDADDRVLQAQLFDVASKWRNLQRFEVKR